MRVKLPKPERPPYTCECHHVYGGARRKHSEKYNCVVYLPRELHTGPTGVHHNKEFADRLHREYQQKLEDAGWTREEFMETFGRNYL